MKQRKDEETLKYSLGDSKGVELEFNAEKTS
jgi:hypothetical protein